MEELLKHYAEKMNQLGADYGLLEIHETTVVYNRLRSMEYRTEEENKLLAQANNKIVNWNSHVKTVISIYDSLMKKDKSLKIPSPSKYFIRGMAE